LAHCRSLGDGAQTHGERKRTHTKDEPVRTREASFVSRSNLRFFFGNDWRPRYVGLIQGKESFTLIDFPQRTYFKRIRSSSVPA